MIMNYSQTRRDRLARQGLDIAASGPLRAAFSLIEMIGVLAILAILIAVIVSTTTRSLDFAAMNLESTNLVNFATAFQNSALRNRVIPGPTGTKNWVQMIAAELGVSPSMVNNNARSSRRVLMIDPNNTITLPYTQAANGTRPLGQPIARVMILSTLGTAFPAGFVDGTTTDFGTIWNTPDGTLPAFSASNPLHAWNGRGSDLMVQRIDLGSSFVHLVLWNYPPPNPPQGQYQIDRPLGNLTLNKVPANASFDSYFLNGTILSLLDDKNPATLQVDQILSRNAAFFYIQGVWRGTLNLGNGLGQNATNLTASSEVGAAFSASTAAFLASKYNSGTTTTPPMVANAMSNFMAAYINYANAGFPKSPDTSYTAAKAAQTAMFDAMDGLVKNANAGGCSNAPGASYP